jgi:UDPglucose 6-dehydrogenase
MKISIVGSGVVGRATGIGFHKHDNEVLFCDVREEKLVELRKEGYAVTSDLSEAISNSQITFISVQTPSSNKHTDLSYIEKATADVAKTLRDKSEYHVVVIRSTVPPSYTRSALVPLLRSHSGLEIGRDIGVCGNPEFLRQATALDDFLNPSRIVIGEFDRKSGDVLQQLYLPFKAPLIRTDLDTAEMIKLASNAFLCTKISFFNELYIICQNLGLDANLVAESVGLDPRIGKYGIHGGKPFGGNCLPKDLEAFIDFIKDNGMNPKLLDAALIINDKVMKMQDP